MTAWDTGHIPAGWAWARLGEIADVQLGKMLDTKRQTGEHTMPYLRNVNVQWHRTDLDDLLHMDIAPNQRERYTVRAGDLLVCEGGEPGRCAIVPDTADGLAFQKALHRVRPAEGILPSYLAYMLELMALTGRLTPYFTGSTIKHLPREKMLVLPVPVAPSDEQKRIVAQLDEGLTQLAQTSTSTTVLLRKLQALRDALLSRFLPNTGEPTVTVGSMATVGSGATPLKSDSSYYAGGTIPWVTSADLNTGIVTKARQFITDRALEKTAVKLWPAGTLLVAMYGEGQTRGRCARLDISSATNQACAAIVLNEDAPVLRDFLHLFLDASYMRMRRLAAGGVQPNLSLGLIKEIAVPARSHDQQVSLVAETRAALDKVDRVRQALESLSRRQTALRRAVLAAGCAGRLVNSDPADESAELLLKIIAEQRTTAAPSGRGRRARTVSPASENTIAQLVEQSA